MSRYLVQLVYHTVLNDPKKSALPECKDEGEEDDDEDHHEGAEQAGHQHVGPGLLLSHRGHLEYM